MFSDGLEEFDSSREVVQHLIDEYQACEGMNYVNWNQSEKEANGIAAPKQSAPELTARLG